MKAKVGLTLACLNIKKLVKMTAGKPFYFSRKTILIKILAYFENSNAEDIKKTNSKTMFVFNLKPTWITLVFYFYPITLPFGTAGSTVRRVNFPSCSADRIIPWLTYFFIILRGLRLATIWTFLPTNSCSFG